MAPAESKRSILLITNDLGPHAGGIETFLLGLIDQLDGKDIVIYTSREEGFEEFDKNLEKSTGVKVIRDKSSLLIPTPRITKKAIAIAKEFQSEMAMKFGGRRFLYFDRQCAESEMAAMS